ncbi:oligogalacturonide lyase [Povalibacter uvarum]|uniref:Oligogalacturonide lyase n=1 Tax=Povalibacter uvarum TaxID=732238 RepID=A0A841HUF9_9GAMM|nr:oligogalacturonate lyase family protein [Povalibacter uvarum]MBB6095475.1 oligogalacturonide lyase [Povalibacter uvarum]
MIRLSDEPGTRSLYFHQNSITPDGRFVIVSGNSGITAVEIATRRNQLIVSGKANPLFVGRRTGLLYFSRIEDGEASNANDSGQQKTTTIFAIAATGGKARKIATLERGFVGSVNADETLLLGVYAERDFALESGPRDPRFDNNYAALGRDGKPLTFAEAKEVRLDARVEAAIPMTMFTIDVATGKQRAIHQSTAWLNHLQFSPTDPSLIMFCHEGPWHKVDRIWTLRLGDDKPPQLVHRRTMNMEIAGHEFFDIDGKTIWYDLQTPRGEVFWLARANADGSNRQWYHVERDLWSVHYNISPDGTFFAGDGGDEEMVAKAKDGKWLYLLYPEPIKDVAGISAPDAEHLVRPGKLRAEKLVDMRAHDYRLEPNVIFTPDGKWVIFRSNMHGDAYAYMVEVAKAASRE